MHKIFSSTSCKSYISQITDVFKKLALLKFQYKFIFLTFKYTGYGTEQFYTDAPLCFLALNAILTVNRQTFSTQMLLIEFQ